jgi:hypothetical protein
VGQAIGAVLPLAVAIAIFPVPIIVCVLLVGGEDGVAKAGSYVAAWFLGLVGAGAVVLIVADAAGGTDDGNPATWVSALLLILGVLCLVAAGNGWRRRPRDGHDVPTPSWMRRIDDFTVSKSAGVGLAFSAFNPKNVLLTAAAAAEIAEFGLGRGPEFAALLVFAVLASIGVGAPLAFAVTVGERSRLPLERLRSFLSRNSATIMTVLLIVIGAKLLGDAIAGLAS